MMQIYHNAMRMSQAGRPAYILEKGLDMVLLRYGPSLLQHLREGYELKAKFVNGSAEYSWQLTNKAYHLAISRVLFGNPNKIQANMLIISVQEFYDSANVDDVTYRLNVLGWENDRVTRIWETPLDRDANQEYFREGQKKASVLIDLLTTHLHEHRYSHRLLLLLEHDERKGWPENQEDLA